MSVCPIFAFLRGCGEFSGSHCSRVRFLKYGQKSCIRSYIQRDPIRRRRLELPGKLERPWKADSLSHTKKLSRVLRAKPSISDRGIVLTNSTDEVEGISFSVFVW